LWQKLRNLNYYSWSYLLVVLIFPMKVAVAVFINGSDCKNSIRLHIYKLAWMMKHIGWQVFPTKVDVAVNGSNCKHSIRLAWMTSYCFFRWIFQVSFPPIVIVSITWVLQRTLFFSFFFLLMTYRTRRFLTLQPSIAR